jgi:arylsulfatase A-like enzyme/Flp pilus assembly protein TadD
VKLEAAVVALSLLASLAAAAPGKDENVLLITIDTLRADRLGCYAAGRARTAAIDALAVRGCLFDRAFAHTPTTLASHANILLGLTPTAHGVSENSKARVPESCLTLAEYLKARGFATAAFVGAFPLDSRFGLDQGFDVYDDAFPSGPAAMGFAVERAADKVVDAASAWLSGRKGPWFCWVHLWDPHAPYAPPEPYRTSYAADLYSGEVAFVDAQLLRLFDLLRRAGETERTVVVLTADHGESLGEHGELTHGYFAYNSTLRVPLIVAGPGVRPGRVAGEVSHVDILPTVCELLGLAPPAGLHGRSLVPRMNGGPDRPRPIYFESLEPYLNYGCAPLRGLIERGLKYIDSPMPEVYDLGKDEGESSNLAANTNLAALKRRLDALRQTQAGPAAAGPKTADARTRESLRSLGYVASPAAPTKTAFGPEDDLKSFLPYQQRLERAILLSDAGRDDESIREIEALVREKPGFGPAYIYLSQLFRSKGRAEDSLHVLDRGVRANPGDYALLAEYGKSLVGAGRAGEAVGVLTKAVGLLDDDPESWDYLGRARTAVGANDGAREAFERALALDPSSAPTRSDYGSYWLGRYLDGGRNTTDLDQAVLQFERAIAIDPALNPAYRGLGYAFWLSGRIDQAAAAWQRAVGLQPDDDFSTYNLGLLCLERGDRAQARRLFSAILERRGQDLAPAERANLVALIEKCK